MYKPISIVSCLREIDDEIAARLAGNTTPQAERVLDLGDLLKEKQTGYLKRTGRGRLQVVKRPMRRGSERGSI